MTISQQPSTLAALMAAYEKSVVFEEAVPNRYRMAKLFCDMNWSNGGLVLLGVRSDGVVLGIPPETVPSAYARFLPLCQKLTGSRVEMGTLQVGEKVVVYLVFNTITSHTTPLDRYQEEIRDVAMV